MSLVDPCTVGEYICPKLCHAWHETGAVQPAGNLIVEAFVKKYASPLELLAHFFALCAAGLSSSLWRVSFSDHCKAPLSSAACPDQAELCPKMLDDNKKIGIGRAPRLTCCGSCLCSVSVFFREPFLG